MAQDKLCLSPFLSLFLSLSLTRGRPPPLPTCLFRGAVDEGEVPGGAGRHCFSPDQAFSRSSKKILKPGLVVQGQHGRDVRGHRRGLSRCPPLARYFKSYTLKICLSLSLSLSSSLSRFPSTSQAGSFATDSLSSYTKVYNWASLAWYPRCCEMSYRGTSLIRKLPPPRTLP